MTKKRLEEIAKELCRYWKEEFDKYSYDSKHKIIIVTTKSGKTIENYLNE